MTVRWDDLFERSETACGSAASDGDDERDAVLESIRETLAALRGADRTEGDGAQDGEVRDDGAQDGGVRNGGVEDA